MILRAFFLVATAGTFCAAAGGCAYTSEHVKEVTHDRRYWVEYRPGQTYRLKADARLVVHRPGGRHGAFELWSAGVMRRYRGYRPFLREFSPVAMLPAGSTVRVDSL